MQGAEVKCGEVRFTSQWYCVSIRSRRNVFMSCARLYMHASSPSGVMGKGHHDSRLHHICIIRMRANTCYKRWRVGAFGKRSFRRTSKAGIVPGAAEPARRLVARLLATCERAEAHANILPALTYSTVRERSKDGAKLASFVLEKTDDVLDGEDSYIRQQLLQIICKDSTTHTAWC
jgi:hypothetical protein